ncbi:MAG: integrin alpha [Pseudomonadota bacterium]
MLKKNKIQSLLALLGLWFCADVLAQSTELNLTKAVSDSNGAAVDGASSGDLLGWAVSGDGDYNGDGINDLAIAAQGFDVAGANGTSNNAGAVYVVFGSSEGFDQIDLAGLTAAGGGDGSRGFVLFGQLTNENVGNALASAGDVNGDGIDDLLIGSTTMQNALGGGGVYLIFGRSAADPMPAEFFLSNLRTSQNVNSGFGVVLEGSQAGGRSGTALIGNIDVNVDGRSDMVIGSLFFGAGRTPRPGIINVLYGRSADNPWPAVQRLIDLRDNLGTGDEGFQIIGDVASSALGSRLAATGDFTGDGFDDFVMGSPSASASDGIGNSAGFLIPGRVSGPGEGYGSGLNLSLEEERVFVHRLLGDVAEDQAGESVAGVGDVNGDGRPDLAVSAPLADHNGEDSGSVYIFYGRPASRPVPQDYSLAGLLPENGGNGSDGFVLVGAPGQELGDAIAGAGDFNGDGLDDFLVGAKADGQGAQEAGAVYVVYGRAGGFPALVEIAGLSASDQGQKLLGEAADDSVGDRLAVGRDLDRDGNPEILVGARQVDVAGANDGRIYAINGQGGSLAGLVGADSRAWYDPQRAGEGIMVEVGTLDGGPSLFVTWYTHVGGEQLWLAAGPVSLEPDQTEVTMDLLSTSGGSFGADFDADAVAFDVWGSVTFTRVACDQLLWRYQGPPEIGGGQRQFLPLLSDLLQQPGCTENSDAKGAAGAGLGAGSAGAWWDPARAGEGVVVDLETRGAQPTLFFSWFTYHDGAQRWLVGSAPFDPASGSVETLSLVEPAGAQFGAAFNPQDVFNRPWGQATLSFSACDGLAVQYEGAFDGGSNQAGSLSLVRFTGQPFGLSCP